MKINFLSIEGIGIALNGMRLSYNSKSNTSLYLNNKFELDDRDLKLAYKLIKEGNSASKFTRFIIAYLEIEAPRYWWQQFDTYRIGVERLSESTMHTILKNHLTQSNFEGHVPDNWIKELNKYIDEKKFYVVKNLLPESFLQKRFVMASYQALRHIYFDRRNHKLNEWKQFCRYLEQDLPFSKFVVISDK